MDRVSLDGEWELRYFQEGTEDITHPDQLADAKLPLVSAEVPGNVELDLLRAGIIEEPFVGENIHALRPLEFNEWWYTRTFPTPGTLGGRTCRLVFHGLDCIATVWVNGHEAGRADNMFISHEFDITELLHADRPNTLTVRLKSAVNAARGYDYEPSQAAMATNHEQLHIRKAPHMYGWDIAPRAVGAGIWRSVELQLPDTTRILDVAYATASADASHARLYISWQFATESTNLEGFSFRFTGAFGESAFSHEEPARFTAGTLFIPIVDPMLWWPKGYGAPSLYEVRCELLRNGEVVDARVDRIGIRTVELVRTDTTTEAEGGEFLFKVNGTPILCKGSNWVPVDSFHSRDAARYAEALQLCDDLGCNILRCWGGNVYEDTAFFSFCDEHGIMVWQDFAFACALYPQDAAFLERVATEARAVVRKLRNHPSIILWSGDNEVDMGYLHRGLDPTGNAITRRVLPEVCAACDPYRPYLPSSPYAAPEVVSRGMAGERLMPEQHLWGPRDYFKGSYYAEHTAHFASEMGYHGCPNVSSIRRFIDPDALWPWQDNEQWRVHCTDPVPGGGWMSYRIKLMADQIRELFGYEPDCLEDFALASQISQAEAKKFFIEMFRLAKWRRTGVIWWNVLDCWPQFSDAIVDYYFGKKLAYWYIKRVQAPFCIMMDEPKHWHCRVVAGNDSSESFEGVYRVADGDTGAVLLEGDFRSPANTNVTLGNLPASHGEHRLFLMNWEINGVAGGNHYLLGKPPIPFDRYRGYLERIAALPGGFDPALVSK